MISHLRALLGFLAFLGVAFSASSPGRCEELALPIFTEIRQKNEAAVVSIAPSQSLQKGITDQFRALGQVHGPVSFVGNVAVFTIAFPFYLARTGLQFALHPLSGPPQRRGLGTGFFIDPQGFVFTNAHVIEGADRILVHVTEDEAYEGKVVGTDPEVDVALIKIEPKGGKQFPVLTLGDSDAIEPGQWVMGLGFPYGLGRTVTVGVIGATGRDLGAGPLDDFIQTDAAINPGSSGGPLFNTDGQVIGINWAKLSEGQSIGFAIPVNEVKSVLDELKRGGKVRRPWLGITVERITPELQERYRLKREKGMVVTDVSAGGPGAVAGVKEGDVLLKLGDRELVSKQDIVRTIAAAHAGDLIPVVLERKDVEIRLSVKLEPSKN